MAEIVIGLGTSHSPQLSTPPELWDLRGSTLDIKNPWLYTTTNGTHVTYDELLAMADPELKKELTPEVYARRHEANQKGLNRVGQALEAAEPDVLVVVGDDQNELIREDLMPVFTVFWGESIAWVPRNPTEAANQAALGGHPRESSEFPVASDLALHMIGSLIEQNIDVAHSKHLRDGGSVGGAFAFVYGRITDKRIPLIPVMQNTYFPPNQPKPARSYEFGVTLGEAIRSFPGRERVAVVASGGFSHFVVDEDIDRRAIAALREQDVDAMRALPVERLKSGTSEIRNWLTVAGAVGDRKFDLFDYVPCYRSPAGTGCAMAFGQWV
ncbi:MAG: extradiol ring-cleavage dioxygenase [Chloroflexota bacterium]